MKQTKSGDRKAKSRARSHRTKEGSCREKREEAVRAAAEKKKELQRLQKEKRQLQAPEREEPQKKKLPRNDTSRLNLEITPRTRASRDGAAWDPPRKNGRNDWLDPGSEWVSEARNKFRILKLVVSLLRKMDVVPPTMSFGVLMEFIGADDPKLDLDFNDRSFLYLVALSFPSRGMPA